jgi:glycosyltransferase involved in cell wall biosynthesis
MSRDRSDDPRFGKHADSPGGSSLAFLIEALRSSGGAGGEPGSKVALVTQLARAGDRIAKLEATLQESLNRLAEGPGAKGENRVRLRQILHQLGAARARAIAHRLLEVRAALLSEARWINGSHGAALPAIDRALAELGVPIPPETGAAPEVEIAACTIVSKNYISLARVWNDSFLRHHPGARTFVLLVDRIEGKFDPKGERFELIEIGELGIPALPDLAFKYNITELNTAVKPFFLDYLLRKRGVERLFFFDPDILVLAPLDRARSELAGANVVLTPHTLSPMPTDGFKPTEVDFLISGSYNLGFLGLRRSRETLEFLQWWQDRLQRYCFSAPEQGLFTDQKWIDLVPSLVPAVSIVRDRGYNAAYWNLHERLDLTCDGESYRLGDQPLAFFHFSGLEVDRPERVSKYQNRFRMRDLGDAYRRLFFEYIRALGTAGLAETSKWPYTFDRFEDGVRIPDYLRRLYQAQAEAHVRWPDPFSTGVENSLRSWLLEPSRLGSRIPRILSEIYRTRVDLHNAFPDGERSNAKALLRWAVASAAREYKLDEFFIEEFRRRAAEMNEEERPRSEPASQLNPLPGATPAILEPAPARRPFGVNLFGYFDTESGVGEVARCVARTLRDARVPHALINIEQTWLRRRDSTLRGFSMTNPYSVNLLMVNADQAPSVITQFGPAAFTGRTNIGYWFWELSRFPEAFAAAFPHFDQIWVASSFCLEAIAARSPIPVVKVPPGFDFHVPGLRDRRSFEIGGNDFVFLYAFDGASSVHRKNPAGAISAFRRAFPTPGRERLILKTTGIARSKLDALARLAGNASVAILNEYLNRDELLDLLAAADCYVSLHRSEGFGLTILESIAMGKPVIATGYSGCTDFLDSRTGFPVGYRLVPIRRNLGPYPKGELWADPDLEEAARLMRWVRENPAEAARIADEGRRQILTSWSLSAAGSRMVERLNRFDGKGLSPGAPDSSSCAAPA